MKKQKQDYEKCLESVTQLTHQLDSAMLVRYTGIFAEWVVFLGSRRIPNRCKVCCCSCYYSFSINALSFVNTQLILLRLHICDYIPHRSTSEIFKLSPSV